MGNRGPAPTSKRTLQRRGSWRAKSRSDDLELSSDAPTPPRNLSAEAKAEWKRIVGELAPKGALSKVDRAGLTMLCEAWADDRALGQRLKLKGTVVGTNDWKRIFTARQQVRETWQRLAARFGITPADRTRIKVNPNKKPKDDGKSRFFNNPTQAEKPRLVG